MGANESNRRDPVMLQGETGATPIRVEGGRRLRAGARAEPPLVTIVSVVFNAAGELTALLESIAAKRDAETELVVVDGGSKDNTIEVLRRYDDAIDYWVSEPDNGIYDAMNKGIAAATGHYILHLNAGDRLRKIPRQELEQCLADNIDVACFAVDMEGFGIHRPRTGFILRFANSWHHQGTFYRRAGHLGYDTQYRIYGDFDLNQRVVKAGKSVRLSNTLVAEQLSVGVSGDTANYPELYMIVKRNFGASYVYLSHLWYFVSPVVPTLKRWVGR